LEKHDNLSDRDGSLRDGVLRTPPPTWWRLQRFDVSARLEPFVSYAWVASHQLPDGRVHHQHVLPHPALNLVVEDEELLLYGPQRHRFDRVLCGSGRVVGLRFRQGTGRALLDRPVSAITDAAVAADAVGLDGATVVGSVRVEDDAERAAHALAGALGAVLPERPPPAAEHLRDLVEVVAADRGLSRTGDLAALAGVGQRTLQRQFAEHVGVSPAWVVRRYRIQDALAQAGASGDPDWAAVAHSVGYYDQAHLIRDITATVGTSPAAYLAQLSGESSSHP